MIDELRKAIKDGSASSCDIECAGFQTVRDAKLLAVSPVGVVTENQTQIVFRPWATIREIRIKKA